LARRKRWFTDVPNVKADLFHENVTPEPERLAVNERPPYRRPPRAHLARATKAVGVIDHTQRLRSNPEGCQKVAGGRCAAATPRSRAARVLHPGTGCQKHPRPSSERPSGIPPGCANTPPRAGGLATQQTTFFHPSGMSPGGPGVPFHGSCPRGGTSRCTPAPAQFRDEACFNG